MRSVLLSALLAAAPLSAAPSAVSSKLKDAVDALTAGYQQKGSSAGKEPLAVLSFSSSEKLAKTRAGFAVSELLTYFFVQKEAFTVVERGLVNKLEEEQKFQAMSADTGTAVKIGKLIGAKLLALGSIEKLGGAYQVNARLVRVETGEILATAFEELPSKDFEDEAKPYMNLVPERQSIGFYTAYQFRPPTRAGEVFTDNLIGGGSYSVTPRDFDAAFFGAGLRYFAGRRMFVDIAFFAATLHPQAGDTALTSPYQSGNQRFQLGSGSYFLRSYVGWTRFLSPAFRWEAGAGVTKYHLFAQTGFSGITAYSFQPFLRLGGEFRIQERLGAGLFVNEDVGRAEGNFTNGATAFRLDGFSIEPSLALYF